MAVIFTMTLLTIERFYTVCKNRENPFESKSWFFRHLTITLLILGLR